MLFNLGIYASAIACPSNLISTASLLGYYDFDGVYTNDGGSLGVTLTPFNSPIFVSGKFEDAVELNGFNQWMEASGSLDWEPIFTTGWSLATWVSLDDYTNNQSIWDKRVPGSTGMRIIIRPGGTRDVLMTWNSQNASFSLPVGVFTDATFHHMCVRQNTSTNNFQVFIDGTSIGTITRTAYTSPGSFIPLNIGRDRQNNTEHLNGRLDEYSVWDRQLSDVEITALAAGNCPLKS